MSANRHQAFTLRLKLMDNGIRPKWAYFLTSAESGTLHSFDSLAALMMYLQQTTDNAEASLTTMGFQTLGQPGSYSGGL